jgi:two-component system invasion response regulator UvrY
MDLSNKRFLIIEDHEVIIFALQEILGKHFPDANFQAVNSIDQGVQMLLESYVDLIVLDIDVDGGNNPKIILKLREAQPEVKILIHSGAEEDKGSLRYLSAGADGFFSKKDPLQMLPLAINTVLNGKRYINNAMQTLITDNFLRPPGESEASHQSAVFSPRELEVIRLLLEGKWSKEIGDILDIKLSTVSTHKARIFEKLQISSVVELYKRIEIGWPELLDKV